MLNIAVIVSAYPSKEQPNKFGFVHSRVRAYIREGHNVDVYVNSKFKKTYYYENVKVCCDLKENLKSLLEEKKYDALFMHFFDKDKAYIVGDKKCYIWVHGFEALSWKRRLFNLNPRIFFYAWDNWKQLRNFREYVKTHPMSKFIFVSKWMYEVTCKDIDHKIENYSIIHNYIDDSIFYSQKKELTDIKNLLIIRSFENKKYANDISVKIIKEFSKKDYFKELKFTIYGDGRLFDSTLKTIKNMSNVEIHKKFIDQKEIPNLHKKHGVFLCPTRQDSQGVSMCEAMCSGLIPLTSYNTAIPEFVDNGVEGILCDNYDINSFINEYEKLLHNPSRFLEMSRSASKRIRLQCSFENTIKKELELLNE